MQTNTYPSDYTNFFGLILLILGPAWIIACLAYMVRYFPEHGGGAVVMFSVAALFGVYFIHLGRTLIKASHRHRMQH